MTTHDRQTESSEAIRASISQTRSEMGAKIDAIQNRLDPENIKDQAQEAFYSVIEDGADALAGYVRNQAVDLGMRDWLVANIIDLSRLRFCQCGNHRRSHIRNKNRESHPFPMIDLDPHPSPRVLDKQAVKTVAAKRPVICTWAQNNHRQAVLKGNSL